MSISLNNVCFSYKNRDVLNNISLTLKKGHSVAIVGVSGCGKSTLLQLIAGLKDPASGSINGNQNVSCSMVFQEDRLLENLTIFENLKFVNKNITRQSAELILRQLGLTNIIDYYPSSLSGGMKRRISIARALSYDSSLVIMDEPFNGLDYETKLLVMDTIKFYVKDKIFVFVTHDPSDAKYFNADIFEMK